MRVTLCALCLMCALPAAGQDLPPWYARGEVGLAEIHGGSGGGTSDLASPWLGARVGRAFGQRGVFALDVGGAGSSADGGFGTITGGAELRAYTRSPISPFVRLEGGFLTESLGTCVVVGLGGGLSARVTPALSVRGGVLFCVHCWEGAGPGVAHIGVEYRW